MRLTYIKLAIVTGIFAIGMPFTVFAASPYTDQFENYNSEGWLAQSGGGACGFSVPVATTSGYVGAGVEFNHVDCFGNNHSIGFYHHGGFSTIGGYEFYFKTNVSTTRNVDFSFCWLNNGSNCNDTGNFLLGATVNIHTYADSLWHKLDLTYAPSGTSTETATVFIDGVQTGQTTYSTSTILTAAGVVVNGGGYSGIEFLLLDSLNNEFALQQQSQADIINQSFYIASSTAQSLCNGSFATSTGLFSDISNGVSYGLCTVGVFLFVPNTTITGQFAGLPNQALARFPLSWFLLAKNALSTFSASSTINYPSYSYDFGTSTVLTPVLGSTTILQIASPSTIQSLAPDTVWAILRFLAAGLLWFGFVWYLYYRVLRLWYV